MSTNRKGKTVLFCSVVFCCNHSDGLLPDVKKDKNDKQQYTYVYDSTKTNIFRLAFMEEVSRRRTLRLFLFRT